MCCTILLSPLLDSLAKNRFFNLLVTFILWKFQFLAFYLTGGAFSSLISLAEKFAMRSAVPSLGASGAIAAMIGEKRIKEKIIFCNTLRLHLHDGAGCKDQHYFPASMAIFSPKCVLNLFCYPISLIDAIYGIIAFEVVCMLIGAITGARIFDNTAHLGGIFFGM